MLQKLLPKATLQFLNFVWGSDYYNIYPVYQKEVSVKLQVC